MNDKILELAVERIKEINEKKDAIANCEQILHDIKHYGVEALSIKSPEGLGSISYLKDCCLDPGQRDLITQLFKAVLSNRMADAENELKKLLDVENIEQVEQAPAPRRSGQRKPVF